MFEEEKPGEDLKNLINQGDLDWGLPPKDKQSKTEPEKKKGRLHLPSLRGRRTPSRPPARTAGQPTAEVALTPPAEVPPPAPVRPDAVPKTPISAAAALPPAEIVPPSAGETGPAEKPNLPLFLRRAFSRATPAAESPSAPAVPKTTTEERPMYGIPRPPVTGAQYSRSKVTRRTFLGIVIPSALLFLALDGPGRVGRFIRGLGFGQSAEPSGQPMTEKALAAQLIKTIPPDSNPGIKAALIAENQKVFDGTRESMKQILTPGQLAAQVPDETVRNTYFNKVAGTLEVPNGWDTLHTLGALGYTETLKQKGFFDGKSFSEALFRQRLQGQFSPEAIENFITNYKKFLEFAHQAYPDIF